MVEKIRAESAQGKLPSSSALTKLAILAAKYPDDPTFSAALASVEQADNQAMQEANSKQAANNLRVSTYSEVEMRAFEEEAKKNALAAAKKYFNRAEIREADETIEKMVAGHAVSNKEKIKLYRNISSEESRRQRDILSEHLPKEKEKLMLELRSIKEERDKHHIYKRIKEIDDNHIYTEKHRKIYNHVTKHIEEFKQKHGREMTTTEMFSVIDKVVPNVEREILDFGQKLRKGAREAFHLVSRAEKIEKAQKEIVAMSVAREKDSIISANKQAEERNIVVAQVNKAAAIIDKEAQKEDAAISEKEKLKNKWMI